MLVCSCNRICDRRIEAEVDRQIADDPLCLVTPSCVYRGLGERPRCGGCLPLAVEIIQERVAAARRCMIETSTISRQAGFVHEG